MPFGAGVARTTLLLAIAGMMLGAVPSTGAQQRLSGPSPLAGECPVNDRTLVYGQFGAAEELEDESDVAVHPTDPARLAAAWVQDSGSGIVVASSRDSGQSWTRTVVEGLSLCTGGSSDRVIHPRLVFDDGGTLYLAASPLDGFWPDPRSASSHIAVTSSTDGGRTWAAVVLVDEDAGAAPALNDFHPPTTEPGSPGVVSIMWAREEAVAHQLVFSRSTDAGRTWTHRPVEGPVPGGLTAAKLVAHPDGTLIAVVNDASVPGFFVGGTPAASVAPTPLRVIRSTDLGETWTQTAELDPSSSTQWAAAAVTGGGTVHVLWRSRDDTGAEVFRHVRSTDAGATWSEGTALPRGRSAPNAPLPTLAASGERLALLAFEAADPAETDPVATILGSDADHRVDIRLATTSADGRWTWSSLATTDRGAHYLGHFAGLAGAPGGFVSTFVLGSPQAVHGPVDLFFVRVPHRR